jgi:dTMP kinase
MIVAFEGPDGAGKTTQAQLLVERLAEENIPCVSLTQPSSGPMGKLIREHLQGHRVLDREVLGLLFAADRTEQLRNIIFPALERGMVVVCDRWYYSSIVYQSLEGCSSHWVKSINSHIRPPDLLVYCWVPSGDIEDVMQGIERRGRAEKYEEASILRDACARYQWVMRTAEREEGIALLQVNALLGREITAKAVWEKFQARRAFLGF